MTALTPASGSSRVETYPFQETVPRFVLPKIPAVTRPAVVVTTALALIACTSERGDDTASVQAITERAGIWPEAAEAGDTERMISLYATDAVFLPPGSPPVEGRERIADLFRQQFGRFQVDVEFETDGIVVERDLAYRRGCYRADLVGRENRDTVVARDEFLEIWRRGEDGIWRITRDMWNSTRPPSDWQTTDTGGRSDTR